MCSVILTLLFLSALAGLVTYIIMGTLIACLITIVAIVITISVCITFIRALKIITKSRKDS